jgi:hypothetical protein
MRLSLVLPPLTQLNTPYPSISYLARFLRQQGVACEQRDLGLELVLALFSQPGLAQVFDVIEESASLPEPAWRALALRDHHLRVVDPVIAFLQGRDRTLAPRLLQPDFLPQGPRVHGASLEDFGPMGTEDAARHLATLHLEDLADLVTSSIDPGFGLARYNHHLAVGAAPFSELVERLEGCTLVDALLDGICDGLEADVVGLSVPFPGNLYGALRMGKRLRSRGIHVVIGGGYVNTELRNLSESAFWDYADNLCYDDGEGPLLALLQYLEGGEDKRHRTRNREGVHEAAVDTPVTHAAWYGDLDCQSYLQLVDTLNPAHRLWGDGRWNKITLAHGCYWKRCLFCDIHLDYIARFSPADASGLADLMEELVEETGITGFHFVDEAAPPRVMRDLALEILSRNLSVTWWGNIRFEPTFDEDLCRLLSAAGLVAVTGGLEVASDRLLTLMDKGVTVDQVAQVAGAFRRSGVMVHAYIMYGFPTQTQQESIDAMETVRQLFAEGLLDSAFWHRFVLTRHSGLFPVAEKFGLRVLPRPEGALAENDLQHTEEGADHDLFDAVLPQALRAWMQGQALQEPVQEFFDQPMPESTVSPGRFQDLATSPPASAGRLVWLGGEVLGDDNSLVLHHPEGTEIIRGSQDERDWLTEVLESSLPSGEGLDCASALASFPGDWEDYAETWVRVRALGLVVV